MNKMQITHSDVHNKATYKKTFSRNEIVYTRKNCHHLQTTVTAKEELSNIKHSSNTYKYASFVYRFEMNQSQFNSVLCSAFSLRKIIPFIGKAK